MPGRILDHILTLLSADSEAHSVSEIAGLTGLNPSQVERAFKLLDTIEFVEFDGEKARISLEIRQLILLDSEGNRNYSK